MSNQSFARKTVTGTAWVYAAYYAGKLVVFISTVILARILTKTEYGLVGYIVTFISFLDIARDLGIGAALIYHRNDIQTKSTAFWLGLFIGFSIFILMWFSAPVLGIFLDDESIVPVLRLLALNYPIWAVGGTHEAILVKELAFNRKFIPDFSQAFAKGFISIVLALLGYGPWSLIIGHLVGTLVNIIILWNIIPWRPSFEFKIPQAYDLLRFGLPIVGVNILGAIVLNSDYLIIGKYLGKEQLGVYTTAFRIPELIILQFCAIVAQVLFPMFSKIRDDSNALLQGFLQTSRYVSLITIPLGLGMALLTKPFILAVFSEKWIDAIPVMQSISIYALILSIGYNAGDVYKALGVPSILTRISFVKALILIPSLLLAVSYSSSLITIALIQIGVAIIGSSINFIVTLKMLKINAVTLLNTFMPSVIAGIGMALILLVFNLFAVKWSPWIHVIVGTIIGGLSYLLIIWWREPELVHNAKKIFGLELLKR